MRVLNTGSVSYQSETPEKCLETAEHKKKRNSLNDLLNKLRHFTLFFASVYGLLRVEVEATLKRIIIRLTQKYQKPYSRTCGWVKSRVTITLVQATHRCIRGGRVPASRISVTRTQWEYGVGLHHFR